MLLLDYDGTRNTKIQVIECQLLRILGLLGSSFHICIFGFIMACIYDTIRGLQLLVFQVCLFIKIQIYCPVLFLMIMSLLNFLDNLDLRHHVFRGIIFCVRDNLQELLVRIQSIRCIFIVICNLILKPLKTRMDINHGVLVS